MMIEPPIDKLVDKVGCKYALVCLITKRAHYLLDKKADLIKSLGDRAISYAAKEVYDDAIEAKTEE